MIGQRVFVGGVKPGRITFIGEVHFAPGDWAGIVLDEPEGQRFYLIRRTVLGDLNSFRQERRIRVRQAVLPM